MMTRQWCRLVGSVVGLFCVAPVMVALFDRAPPFLRISGHITPAVVRSGETATIFWSGQVTRLCEGVVTRVIVDSIGKIHSFEPVPAVYAQTTTQGVLPVALNFSRHFNVPTFMSPGKARYCSRSSFACNWTQKWWPINTDACTDFEVAP